MSKATSLNPYEFTLVLLGLEELNPEIVEKLGEAGLDDANLLARKGVVTAAFEREAESFEHAVLSAMDNVREASVGVTGFRLEKQDDVVSLAEIARRLGKSRQAVAAYTKADDETTRRRGFFPPPVIDNSGEPLYSWADVAEWLPG